MGLIEILQSVPWDHPIVRRGTDHLFQQLTGTDPRTAEQAQIEREERLFERQAELLERMVQSLGATAAATATAAPAVAGAYAASVSPASPAEASMAGAAGLEPVIARLTQTGASVDEALRFVREDGVDHPEAQRRLMRAQEDLVMLERVDLRPSVLMTLPEDQRKVAEANMQAIREARQALHNAPDGGPPTPESIAQAASRLEAVTTQLRVAKAVGAGVTNAVAHDGPQTPATAGPVTNGPPPYSRYAPDMEVAVGCLPCGRAHLAGTVGAMRGVSRLAKERGMSDPDVQAGLLAANKELVALWSDDWTEEKVAASPEADRAIMEETIPRLRAAQARLESVSSPEDVVAVTEELASVRETFVAKDLGRAAHYASFWVGQSAPDQGDHRLDLRPWTVEQPGILALGSVTQPTDSARAFDALANAIHQARGVRVVFRETSRTDGGIEEAHYDPETNTITMGPFALAKDFYAVQTLAHETAHALTVNQACMPVEPANHEPEEEVARDSALAAMLEAGLPVELRSGEVLEPGERSVDWGMLQDSLPPDLYAQVRFATDWITSAIAGQAPDTLPHGCAVAIPLGGDDDGSI